MVSDSDLKITFVLGIIEKLLRERDRSIAEIADKLDIKRSTLIYYLGKMESSGLITRKRIEDGATGRPTIIALSDSAKEKYKQKYKEQEKFNKELLFFIKNKNPTEEEIHEQFKNKTPSQFYSTLMGLKNLKYVKNNFSLTSEGEKFLEDNK